MDDFQRVTIERNIKFSKFTFEISKSDLHFSHIDCLKNLLETIKDNLRFILYDNAERIYAREFYEKNCDIANVTASLIPFFTDLQGMVSSAEIQNLGQENMKQTKREETSLGDKRASTSGNIGNQVIDQIVQEETPRTFDIVSEKKKSVSPKDDGLQGSGTKSAVRILECIFPESVCEKRFHANMNDLQEHFISCHFRSCIEESINIQQSLLGIPAGGRECPAIPCGYHGPVRYDLVRHFARTHRFLHQKVEEVARGKNLMETAQYKYLQLKGFFRQTFRMQIEECLFCKLPCSIKHLNIHQAMKHFKASYDQEIKTGQDDFGYEPGRCPGPNCGYKAVAPGSRDIMLTLHYVQKHRPIIEMAKLYQPTIATLNLSSNSYKGSLQSSPNTNQEGIPCPFITGSLQLCPQKFVIFCEADLTLLHEHVLSHIPNILLEKVNELIKVASKVYSDSNCGNGCPLSYCSLGFAGKMSLSDHFLESHKMELTIFILKSISKSKTKLLEEISKFLDEYLLEFTARCSDDKESDSSEYVKVKPEIDTLDLQQQKMLSPQNIGPSCRETNNDHSAICDLYSTVDIQGFPPDVNGLTEKRYSPKSPGSDDCAHLISEPENNIHNQVKDQILSGANLEDMKNKVTKKPKLTARKSTSNGKILINLKCNRNERNVPETKDKTDDKDIQYRKKTKSHPTARKRENEDFCCIECNILFWSPRELFDHTKECNFVKSLPNKNNNKDTDKNDDIEILEIPLRNEETRKRKHTGENNNAVQESYYYFCMDCEAERGYFFHFLCVYLTDYVLGAGCRVPISSDIASHIMEKRHTNFTPIRDILPSLKNRTFLTLPNITFSKKWNRKVIVKVKDRNNVRGYPEITLVQFW